jgi:hypothetical protein
MLVSFCRLQDQRQWPPVVPAAFKHLLSSPSLQTCFAKVSSFDISGASEAKSRAFLPINGGLQQQFGKVISPGRFVTTHPRNHLRSQRLNSYRPAQLRSFRTFVLSPVRQRAFDVLTFAANRRRSPMTKKKNKAKKPKLSRAMPLAIAEPRLRAAYSAPRATPQKRAHARSTANKSSLQGENNEVLSPLRAVLRQQALVTSAFFNLLHIQQQVAHAWLSSAQRR